MFSDMDAMFSCSFNLCDVRMRIVITCIVPRDNFRSPPQTKKSVTGGSFIRGKSVKKELSVGQHCIQWPNARYNDTLSGQWWADVA